MAASGRVQLHLVSRSAPTPLVAIPLRPEARDVVPRRMFQNRVYVEAVEAAGAAAIAVPVTADESRLRAAYDCCDAVLLAGGPDVVPELYGEQTRADCNVETAPELDAVDIALARWAIEDGKALLAICRGMQVLNVALGGTLWQDIRRQVDGALEHHHEQRDAIVHQIDVQSATRLRDITRAQSVAVNSVHHQALREVAPALQVTALAPDGLIEAVEHRDRTFAVGIQCHPEELNGRHAWASLLFQEFVAGARA